MPVPHRSGEIVTDVLGEQGVAAEVLEILVTDEKTAKELQFPGSPTIRINGRDVAWAPAESKGFTLRCRLYPGSRQIGPPPAELVRRAVTGAREGD